MNKMMPFSRKRWSSLIPARYILALLGFLGVTLQFVLKVNLSVAIVAMVGVEAKSQGHFNGTCPPLGHSENFTEVKGEFSWTHEEQGLLLSSYYYGYVVTQLLGGYLAQRFGARLVLGPGVFITGVLTLLTAVVARYSFIGLLILRILEGAASGVILPAMQVLFSRWYPPQERQRFSGIIFSSINFGSLAGMGLSGLLAVWGWPSIFYVEGTIAIVWFILWMLLVYDAPQCHPWISEEEKNYIVDGLGQDPAKRKIPKKVPWKKIFFCPPVWAGILMHTGSAWILYTLLNELPTYLSNILHYNVKNSGVISSLPYLVAWINGSISGSLSQWVRSKGCLSHINTYKLFNGLIAVGAASCFLVITLVGCDPTTIVCMFVMIMYFNSFIYGGSYLNHVDLAPNHAGAISGVLHTVANTPGFITPLVTAVFIEGEQTRERWQNVFYVNIGVIMGVYIFYLIFGSTTERQWNNWGMSNENEESKSREKGNDLEVWTVQTQKIN